MYLQQAMHNIERIQSFEINNNKNRSYDTFQILLSFRVHNNSKQKWTNWSMAKERQFIVSQNCNCRILYHISWMFNILLSQIYGNRTAFIVHFPINNFFFFCSLSFPSQTIKVHNECAPINHLIFAFYFPWTIKTREKKTFRLLIMFCLAFVSGYTHIRGGQCVCVCVSCLVWFVK